MPHHYIHKQNIVISSLARKNGPDGKRKLCCYLIVIASGLQTNDYLNHERAIH